MPQTGGGTIDMAIITGSDGIDRLSGTAENDELLGLSGDDLLLASVGNDTLNGGLGIDVADYSGLDEDITLTPGGGVTKSSGSKDFLVSIETIVGNGNRINTIDASTAGTGAGMDVDLSTNSMRVFIPNLGYRDFKVENFSNIVGTNSDSRFVGNDRNNKITGGSGNDRMVGSKGNDTMNGGGGNNTMDYSNLNTAVKILPRGVIDKGVNGRDNISNFQQIIGAANKANTVDASTADLGASLDLNLQNNSLKVNIPNVGSQQFEVVNFVNAIGSKNNDSIVGSNANSTLIGGGGSDTIRGGSGNDRITGTDSKSRGVGEVDTLTGGGGADKFILGDRNGGYYLGNGANDYALITDFNLFQDSIDIGRLSSYSFGYSGNNVVDLYSGKNPSSRDLIAKIQLSNSRISKGSGTMAKTASFGDAALSSDMGLSSDALASQFNIVSSDNSTLDAIV